MANWRDWLKFNPSVPFCSLMREGLGMIDSDLGKIAVTVGYQGVTFICIKMVSSSSCMDGGNQFL